MCLQLAVAVAGLAGNLLPIVLDDPPSFWLETRRLRTRHLHVSRTGPKKIVTQGPPLTADLQIQLGSESADMRFFGEVSRRVVRAVPQKLITENAAAESTYDNTQSDNA